MVKYLPTDLKIVHRKPVSLASNNPNNFLAERCNHMSGPNTAGPSGAATRCVQLYIQTPCSMSKKSFKNVINRN